MDYKAISDNIEEMAEDNYKDFFKAFKSKEQMKSQKIEKIKSEITEREKDLYYADSWK